MSYQEKSGNPGRNKNIVLEKAHRSVPSLEIFSLKDGLELLKYYLRVKRQSKNANFGLFVVFGRSFNCCRQKNRLIPNLPENGSEGINKLSHRYLND
jgi:hypothetical protein